MEPQSPPVRPSEPEPWPALPLEAWADTCRTLHLWTQVVGKVRLARAPHVNHWWQVTLYLTSRGLTTSPIPHGPRTFQVDFDFVSHELLVRTSEGRTAALALRPRSVADFHAELQAMLGALHVPVTIWTMPQEIEDPVPFDRDTRLRAYDPEHAHRFWRALVQADRVLQRFRAGFLGKCSPVHFFWGSFDLAVTRFSGRRAPEHPGGVPHMADRVTREAYSHELSSAGWWPGGGACPSPPSTPTPTPSRPASASYPVRPAAARYEPGLGEFLLPYDAVRTAADPDATLLEFLQSTYEAAAERGGWDRGALERG